MPHLIYYETGSIQAPYNLAMEEVLAKTLQQNTSPDIPGYFLLWQNSPSVIIGRHQNAQAEVRLAELENRNITLVRRLTGGGAVYHDLGNLNFSFLLPCGRAKAPQAGDLLAPLIAYLGTLGVTAHMEGRNDLTIPGAGKFSGLAGRQISNMYQLHGTLLFDLDLGVLEHVLQVDPEKYKSKGVQSVKARVTNLKPFLSIGLPAFWAGLKEAYAPEHCSLPPDIATAAARLAKEKYDTAAWNVGQSPPADITLKKRFPFGSLELHLGTQKNIITTVRITGDFLTSTDGIPIEVERLAESLLGLPADNADAWSAAWASFDMRRIFYGTTTTEEVAGWLKTAL